MPVYHEQRIREVSVRGHVAGPKALADHGLVRMGSVVFTAREHAAQLRPHAQYLKESGRYAAGADLLGAGRSGDNGVLGSISRDLGEGARLILPIKIVSRRE